MSNYLMKSSFKYLYEFRLIFLLVIFQHEKKLNFNNEIKFTMKAMKRMQIRIVQRNALAC